MPLMEHLLELRRRLMYAGLAFLLCAGICYYFSQTIYLFLAQPLADVLIKHGQSPKLIYTGLTEAFFTYLKVAMFGGAFFSFPIAATQLWLFIAPGLYRSEKRAIAPFLVVSPVLFVLGGALAYYVVFPAAWDFFASFQNINHTGDNSVQIELDAKVSEYLGLVMKLILAFGLTFQIPVALTLLAKVGIISSRGMKKMRRYAWVGMFIIAAILAPPDPLTMTFMALPLVALFEISIIAARYVERKPVES